MVEPFENVYELPMDDHNAPNFELSALIRKWNNQLDVFFKARRKRDKVSVLLITMLLICLLVAVALIIMHVIGKNAWIFNLSVIDRITFTVCIFQSLQKVYNQLTLQGIWNEYEITTIIITNVSRNHILFFGCFHRFTLTLTLL